MASESNGNDILRTAINKQTEKKKRGRKPKTQTSNQYGGQDYSMMRYGKVLNSSKSSKNANTLNISNAQLSSLINDSSSSRNISNNVNETLTWNKLTKTNKITKLNEYIDTELSGQYQLTASEIRKMKRYVRNLLDHRRLLKNTDVDYDNVNCKVLSISIISFNTDSRNFTLNNSNNNSSPVVSNSSKKKTRNTTAKRNK